MKKILTLTLILVFALAMTAAAQEKKPFSERLAEMQDHTGKPKIALYINVDPNGISDPTKAAELIYNDLKDELHKTGKVHVTPSYDDTSKLLRRYIREHSTADSAREKDFGFVPKKQDLINLAKEADTAYILYLNARISNTQQKLSIGGFRTKNTLLFEIIITDKQAQNYLVDDVFTETGSSQGTSYDRAFNKALTNILEKIDLSKLNF